MLRVAFRVLAVTFLVASAFALSACSNSSGHTRGMFAGQVIGKSEAEIVDKYGQPASADRNRPDLQILTYKGATFDPDNENKPDAETVIYLTKGKDGRVVASDILFKG
jgi:hypothetical protein